MIGFGYIGWREKSCEFKISLKKAWEISTKLCNKATFNNPLKNPTSYLVEVDFLSWFLKVGFVEKHGLRSYLCKIPTYNSHFNST